MTFKNVNTYPEKKKECIQNESNWNLISGLVKMSVINK